MTTNSKQTINIATRTERQQCNEFRLTAALGVCYLLTGDCRVSTHIERLQGWQARCWRRYQLSSRVKRYKLLRLLLAIDGWVTRYTARTRIVYIWVCVYVWAHRQIVDRPWPLSIAQIDFVISTTTRTSIFYVVVVQGSQ